LTSRPRDADDLNDHILARCALQPRSEAELTKSSGAARRTVAGRVEQLEARGLLVRRTNRAGTVGRPLITWEPLAAQEVGAFERASDAFVLELLEAQVEDQRAAIDARRAQDVQLTQPGTPNQYDASSGDSLM
jgi:predicted ArsR family transcriptional regulator